MLLLPPPPPPPLPCTAREELQAQKESLEARDKQIKEKDALTKKLRELGKNFRAKYEAKCKEVDELKGSLSSQEKVGVWGGVLVRVCVCACVCACAACTLYVGCCYVHT